MYGYKNLRIKLIYDAVNFYCYATSSYDKKVEPDLISGLKPLDYMSKLKPWIPEDYVTNKEELKNKMSKFGSAFGEIITAFKLKNNRGKC